MAVNREKRLLKCPAVAVPRSAITAAAKLAIVSGRITEPINTLPAQLICSTTRILPSVTALLQLPMAKHDPELDVLANLRLCTQLSIRRVVRQRSQTCSWTDWHKYRKPEA